MKKIALLLVVPLLTGCVSWNTQASLTSRYESGTNSVQDLEESIQTLKTQSFEDKDNSYKVTFYYHNSPSLENLHKATLHNQPNFAFKEIMNFYFKNGEVYMVKLEEHELVENATSLKNHSFMLENNQVIETHMHNSKEKTSQTSSEEIEDINNKVLATLEYLTTNYLSEI
jgi:hypothetical protein